MDASKSRKTYAENMLIVGKVKYSPRLVVEDFSMTNTEIEFRFTLILRKNKLVLT